MIECRRQETQTKVITLTNQHTEHTQSTGTNQNLNQTNVAGAKRGKTCKSDWRLVLILPPIE